MFAIGSVQDPGIEEARSSDIPVVGYGESAMHFARPLGSRFAVVAFGAGFDQMLDLRVKRLGLTERRLTALMDADFAAGESSENRIACRCIRRNRGLIARGAPKRSSPASYI